MYDCFNECTTIFWIDPNQTGGCNNPPPVTPESCSGCDCYCGYIQYESLIPYLGEIRSSLKDSEAQSSEFEFKLREQIVEISRLFDIEAGVKAGYFTKAHYATTKLALTNGTQYLKVPDFVPDTLDIRTAHNQLLDKSAYIYKDGYLMYHPCMRHQNKRRCRSSCSYRQCERPVHWPGSCYYVTARWGKECADMAVQKAIRDYLIETYRSQDPVVVAATGLSVSRGFVMPHAWTAYINNFRQRRHLFSQFAIA